MSTSEIQSYLARARQDLKAAEQILSGGFYHVTVTRSYYAMFYAVQALLLSQNVHRHRHAGVLSATTDRGLAEQILRDAQRFVQRTEQYLEQAGAL